MNAKEMLRKEMKYRLKRQTQRERRRRSVKIQKKVFEQKEFLVSRCVMLYVSKGTKEVETGPIIKKALQMGKKVVLPVTLVKERSLRPVQVRDPKKDLRKSSYGIYEPKKSKFRRPIEVRKIDLAIVPGLAFDVKMNRLGRGKGYYDRFLRRLPENTPKIGLGFRFQVFENIPATERDFPLTKVITD